MAINMFAKATDPESNLHYIYQQVDKADKNHTGNDTNKANQGQIYAVSG